MGRRGPKEAGETQSGLIVLGECMEWEVFDGTDDVYMALTLEAA